MTSALLLPRRLCRPLSSRMSHTPFGAPGGRFHWPNHKNNTYCKANVDPAKCPSLTPDMNMEAAEEVRLHAITCVRPNARRAALFPSSCAQSFAWLARSKHLFRHMNEARFNFAMLRLMELRNRHLCAAGIKSRARPS